MRQHAAWLAEGESDKRIVVREARGSGDVAYCVADYSTEATTPDGSTADWTSIGLFWARALK